jgi:hypothetical protein
MRVGDVEDQSLPNFNAVSQTTPLLTTDKVSKRQRTLKNLQRKYSTRSCFRSISSILPHISIILHRFLVPISILTRQHWLPTANRYCVERISIFCDLPSLLAHPSTHVLLSIGKKYIFVNSFEGYHTKDLCKHKKPN